MRTDADLLDHVVERLVAIKMRLGPRPYREAIKGALAAIARAALAEAERRANVVPRLESRVVRFPLSRRHTPEADEDDVNGI